MINIFKYILKIIGLIDCVHDFGKWKTDPKYVVIRLDGTILARNLQSDKQRRVCKKCNYEESRYK